MCCQDYRLWVFPDFLVNPNLVTLIAGVSRHFYSVRVGERTRTFTEIKNALPVKPGKRHFAELAETEGLSAAIPVVG
jgi:hypothetical protein